MKRIIGIPTSNKTKSQVQPPPQNLSTVVSKIDAKADELDKKIVQCETELKKISNRIRSLPNGESKNALKLKAHGILQRKKKFEEQSEICKQQSFNFDQTASAMQSAKDAVIVAKSMKSGVKELKQSVKKINVDKIEDLQDELEELLEDSEDVQEALATNLTIPPELSDQELDEQLDLLGDELATDNDTSYLDDAIGTNRPHSSKGQETVNDLMTFPDQGVPNTNANSSHPNFINAVDENDSLNLSDLVTKL